MREISEIALENGNVKVIGRDEKGATTLRSDDFPQELHDKFDPDVQNERAAFFKLIPQRKNAAN